MLEGPRTTMIDTPAPSAAVQEFSPETLQSLRDLLARLQGELKFKQARIDALNFEVARLKRWRFGSSRESLDTSTQAVLFEHILADTVIEDRAAQDAKKPAAANQRATSVANTPVRAARRLRLSPCPRR